MRCRTANASCCSTPATAPCAYADRVLARAVAWLDRQTEAFDPMLHYVSDHGESLAERNMSLHGCPLGLRRAEQTHVPMLL